MKIVYLTHNINPKTGWGRYASDLIQGIKSAGHDVVVLKEEDDGFEGIPILKRGKALFTSAIRVRKYVKACDIIHAIDFYPFGIIAYLANILIQKKFILSVVGTYSVAPLYKLKTAFLSRAAYRMADRVIAISNFTKKEIERKVARTKIKVINPGIDVRRFLHSRADDLQERSRRYIISVGALKSRKGYHISIPAFAQAKNILPDLQYKIVGSQKDTFYFQELKAIVKKYNIENDVEFLHSVTDRELKNLYQYAELFILTSLNENHHFEGFGIVFLEAAASGLPVIGTLGNGIEDAVNNEYNGILVPQNNIEKTADSMISILTDQVEWQRMRRESHTWANRHNLENMIMDYLALYGKV